MEELKTPSFQLGIHFDEIEGEIREAKARELIEFMQRNNRLPEPASK